jgi:hypothetical protein
MEAFGFETNNYRYEFGEKLTRQFHLERTDRYGNHYNNYGYGYNYGSNKPFLPKEGSFKRTMMDKAIAMGYDPYALTLEQTLSVYEAEGFGSDFVLVLENGTKCPSRV